MAATKTMPQTTTMTATPPAPTNSQHPQRPPAPAEPPDWLTCQHTILREAPDGDTACRLLLAAALQEIDRLKSHTYLLEAELAVARLPALGRRPTPSLRPAILALLAKSPPLSRMQIEEALEAHRSLAEPLRDMVKTGRLLLTDGRYALPRETGDTGTRRHGDAATGADAGSSRRVAASGFVPASPSPAASPSAEAPPPKKKGGRPRTTAVA